MQQIPPLTRILYVDDDPDIREIVRLALETVGGFMVALCGSGGEALSTAPAFAPDLILLDVMMPEMDGPQTLESLRRLPQTTVTPVVFLTARVQRGDVEHYRRLGAADVIVKPFDPMRLAEDITRIWQRHHELRG